MSSAFTKLSQNTLNAAVAGLLCPRIEAALSDRGPGHCMRVTDLDDDVMESVCKELRRTRPEGNIFILGNHDQEGQPFRVTSTKLVELRNPDANGDLTPHQRRGLFRRGNLRGTNFHRCLQGSYQLAA